MARVEALSGLSAIPAEYIRPEEERRDLGDAFELEVASIHAPVRIPVVDIGAFDSEEPSRRAACVEAVRAAAADWGVMHIAGHGIPSELIERLRAAGMAFFALPIEKKEAYANDPSAGRMQGYGSKLATNASGQLEWEDYFFHLVHPFHMADLALWPKHPPEYLEVTKEFGRQMRELSSKMLSILSLGMGLQPERLERELSGVEQSSSDLLLKLKINYYPRCPQPDLAVGVEAHTDVSSLSFILHNGVPGLQVHHQGSWVTARSVPDTIIVHIGDALEILTNARYTSVLHRGLVNREAVRVSWVVFCEPPPDDVVLQPLPELVTDAASARFTPRTFAQHLERKLFKKAQEGQGTTAIDGNSRPEK